MKCEQFYIILNQYQNIDYYQITIDIPGMRTNHLVPHDFAPTTSVNEKQPVITILNNGTVTDSKMITGDSIVI